MLTRIRAISSVIIITALVFSSGLHFGHQTVAAADGEGQGLPPIELPEKGNPKLDSQLNQLVSAETSKRAASFPQESNIELVDGKVRVIVECLPDQIDAATKAAGALGVVETNYDNLLQVVVPISQLTALADTPSIGLVRLPWYPLPTVVSEGVGLISADDWHSASYNGTGVKVGILDGGFSGYTSLLGTELPATVTTWWAPSIGGPGTSVHGTACAEIVYDIAPAAAFYMANFKTEVEMGNAVNWLIAQGVNVISCSVGWPAAGPGDGTGTICGIVNNARSAGILWSQAVGNGAQCHWQGDFSDTDSDGWHNFSGADETNNINVNSGNTITVALNWDDSWGSSGNDYNLYLYNASLTKVARSENRQDDNDDPWEGLSYTATYTGYYHIAIAKYTATREVNFHLYSYNHDLQYQVAASSFLVPADSPSAMAVGAVDYSTPTAIESFSSRGPTKDGRVKPDLVAPDGVSTRSYGTAGFHGTSAAAPHAAGAAVLVKQQFPSYIPAQIVAFLEGRAVDLGTAGKDNLFGSGRLNLGSPGDAVLTMAVNGNGTVTPSIGTHTYTKGTVVNITANPSTGWKFGNWTGNVTNATSTTTTVNMITNMTVTANFVQIQIPPVAVTRVATDVTSSSATLNGNLTSLGSAGNASVNFEWGQTPSFGNATTIQMMNATGTFSAPLSGLTANTTYHFRAKAVGNGISYGNDMTFATLQAPVVVTFPDPNLNTAIRQAINKPSGDIYQSDLTTLTSFTASNKGISNLTGLEYCTNLTTLVLDNNQISDISPLTGLTNLQYLYLSNNQISNISPLTGLTNLQYLSLGVNQISNISPLAGLTTLQLLWLGNNQISDISPLSGLTTLQLLWLGNNQISNLSPLSGMTNLQQLDLSGNQISNITALVTNQGIGSGDTVDLSYNYLNLGAGSQNMLDIQTLINRGASVTYQPQSINYYTLALAVNGNGTTTPPVGNYSYPAGTVVNLTATPSAGWQFVNWTGNVTSPGTANTTVIMDSSKTVTANFGQIITYNLAILINGGGNTTPVPGNHTYPAGTAVNITATPDIGWGFSNWSGDANGTANPIYITMSGNKTVTANFKPQGITQIGAIKQNPALYEGFVVSLNGTYRGWESGHGTPPVTRSDWVIQDGTGAIYVTGSKMGLNYPADVGKPVEVTGRVKTKNGVPYLEISGK